MLLCRVPIALFALLMALNTALAQSSPKSPDAFLPHRLGEAFTPHHLLTAYFNQLAAASTATMRMEEYGSTHEARPLRVAYFSSPENMARLEAIRLNNLRLAGLVEGLPDTSNPIAIVWLSMSVHGNEPTGSECSMLLAYQLATQTDASLRAWLKNTVVVVDPSLNPDGYDRYTHWNRMASNRLKNTNADSREHREPWPGGRVNHYYFDLNRDWAWATQIETRQRLRLYQRWMPHFHADLHEQGVDEPYYFAPAAEPMHDYITPAQRDMQVSIGKNHATYFDAEGWLYFTKEVFDLFYPAYGDTYPMFNGAIGMTYEQGGGPRSGRAIVMENEDTLTLHDRIAHHLATSRSTIEMASKNAAKITAQFRRYFTYYAEQPQGQYKTFVVPVSNDANKVNALCRLLDQHQIQYGIAGSGKTGLKGFAYATGKEETVAVQVGDLIISAYQPKSVLVQVLFEPESRLSDSLTYDITAWALPFAHGLEAYALRERIQPKAAFTPYRVPEVMLAAVPYAWCVRRRSIAEATFMADLLQQGVKARYASKAFNAAGLAFEPGTYVLTQADNRLLEGSLDRLVKAAAAKHNVMLTPLFTGFNEKGGDFGAESFRMVRRPEVAIFYGDDSDENAFGHLWHFFEQELNYPVAVLQDRSSRITLSRYNTILIPNGSYKFASGTQEAIAEWVRKGGRLIALEGGIKEMSNKTGFELNTRKDERKDWNIDALPYEQQERARISEQMPGAIVRAKADNTHPLAYGLGAYYFSLKNATDAYDMPEKSGEAPIFLEDNYQKYGFIGHRVQPQLKKTPIVAQLRIGRGEAVYFTDSPVFRSFWQQGKMILTNALFF